ncbi:MAG TPA: hypothetical protein VGC76_01275 [Pyrinomonadaceae bacterium]|jgi:hypothetical protein
MNFEELDTRAGDFVQYGYKTIFDDIEQKYSYFILKAGEMKEIPRNELIEMIKTTSSMPVIEIREKIYETCANG